MVMETVYLDQTGAGAVTCPGCGRKKNLDVSRFLNVSRAVRAKCTCGHSFHICLEKRQQYRKTVSLHGSYLRQGPPKEVGELLIQDISRSGVGFRTNFKNTLKPEDTLKLTFTLDDADGTVITKNAVVKWVADRKIGAEFCDGVLNRALAFYLMP